MSIRQTMLDHAYHLLRQGQRPTADALVSTCGGSKATATQVLGEFWSSFLPPRLATEIPGGDATPPGTVLALAAEVWRRALDHANKELQPQVTAAIEEAEEAKAQIALQRERMSESTREAERRIEETLSELASLRAKHQEAIASNTELRRERDDSRRSLAERELECQRLSAAMSALNEERATLIANMAELQRQAATRIEDQRREVGERLSEIKALYHESESRLRVELDAARTDASKARQDAVRARDGWEGRLEAERTKAARELAERVAEVKTSADAQIATLRELLLRPRADPLPERPDSPTSIGS